MQQNLAQDSERPAVWLWILSPVSEPSMEPVLWGLEEEGVPIKVQQISGGSASDLARQAAQGSPLDVGIGLDGTRREAALQHRDLIQEKPLFLLKDNEFQPKQLRRLGTNAARLVKRQPLVLDHQPRRRAETQDSWKPSEEEIEALITRIVNQILDNR